MPNLETIVMQYTGWNRQTAQAAISQWTQSYGWDGHYICKYLRPNNGVQLTRRAGEIVDNENIAGGEQLTPDR